jgi:hypothetical protein
MVSTENTDASKAEKEKITEAKPNASNEDADNVALLVLIRAEIIESDAQMAAKHNFRSLLE